MRAFKKCAPGAGISDKKMCRGGRGLCKIVQKVGALSPPHPAPPPPGDSIDWCISVFIISFTLILAADWSIAVGYWIVFHCFSLVVNFRMGISVLSSLSNRGSMFYPPSPWLLWLTSSLQVTASFFYITRHTKRIKNKKKLN